MSRMIGNSGFMTLPHTTSNTGYASVCSVPRPHGSFSELLRSLQDVGYVSSTLQKSGDWESRQSPTCGYYVIVMFSGPLVQFATARPSDPASNTVAFTHGSSGPSKATDSFPYEFFFNDPAFGVGRSLSEGTTIAPVCMMVLNYLWVTCEIEASAALVIHVTYDHESRTATWLLCASKRDPHAYSRVWLRL